MDNYSRPACVVLKTPGGIGPGSRRRGARKGARLAPYALGRPGKPAEDSANAIAHLLDHEKGYTTGQTVGVDGGLTSLRPLPRRFAKG